MSLVIPATFAQVVMNFSHPSTPRQMSVTFGVEYDPLGPDAGVQIADRAAQAWVDSTLRDRTDSSITLASIDVTIGPTPDPIIFSKAYGTAGNTAFETPPLNTALLVRKNSAVGGRANRGRFYWPGLLAETDVNEVGIINPASVTAIQTDFNAFFTELAAAAEPGQASLAMVVLHDEDSPATVPTPVTSLSVDGLAATQRRRMRG